MRIVFAGGGTGGHINPAISLADFIKTQDKDFEALFIGTKRGLETKLVPKAGYDIKYIDIQGFNRKNLIKNVSVLKKLLESKKNAKKILKEFKPDAVVLTGGYVSGPVAMAAHKLKIPSIIHEQNVYPGLTVKGSVNYVDYVAVSFKETIDYIKDNKKCVLTGNPVREELVNADYTKARKELGIDDKPFVLIFGGSLGAEKINKNVQAIIPRLIAENKVRVLFGTGEKNYDTVIDNLGDIKLNDNIKIVPYINNMHTAMAAADLVISRSGAITISEISLLSKASILIPSPNVVRNHQEQNARALEAAGAAIVICEDELTPDVLYEKMNNLISDKNTLIKMGENAKKVSKPDALSKLYDTLIKAINNK